MTTMNNHPPPAAATAVPIGRALKPALMAGAMIAIAFSLPMLGAASAESTLTHLIGEGGVRGPAMFLLLATLLTAFVAGYAFGAWDGAAIALVSQIFACGIDFTWSRVMGRAFVYRKFGPALRKIDATLAARPFVATLAFRLMPVGSNILLNLAAGLSSVRALPFIAASALGFIPQTVIFALIGRGSAPSHGDVLGIGIAMFALSAICGILLLRKYRQLAV
jgi:uncharacterized membrane protein YdjX (TVP38/TMEM64 family)